MFGKSNPIPLRRNRPSDPDFDGECGGDHCRDRRSHSDHHGGRPEGTWDTGDVALSPEPHDGVPPEPITSDAPGRIDHPLLTQSWLDLTFLHWAADPADIAPLLPTGVAPDTLAGVTYVGLVAFRMHRIGWRRLPGLPYLGTFPQTNVRLYSVDARGRRGVVFRSLDAARLLPVALARTVFQLPYRWSRMAIRTDGGLRTYTSARRWPGPRDAHSRITIRVGEPIARPTELDHFLTARWGLHTARNDHLLYLPNTHPRWPLHRAELLDCDETLLEAAGLAKPDRPPISVLYSPGVAARLGRPDRPR
ncbi:Uncharacterized conserved protein [Nocardia otitidiscaviarum]|uniref:Uncharacterized conserved protein n=1 Tax=Nocardia otitidiscaviarum TaxID=1823 RepID=A0A378YVW4_9NOCA|nr:Uncharacterized conserved protein [Nocardia otitidiscaviarum]